MYIPTWKSRAAAELPSRTEGFSAVSDLFTKAGDRIAARFNNAGDAKRERTQAEVKDRTDMFLEAAKTRFGSDPAEIAAAQQDGRINALRQEFMGSVGLDRSRADSSAIDGIRKGLRGEITQRRAFDDQVATDAERPILEGFESVLAEGQRTGNFDASREFAEKNSGALRNSSMFAEKINAAERALFERNRGDSNAALSRQNSEISLRNSQRTETEQLATIADREAGEAIQRAADDRSAQSIAEYEQRTSDVLGRADALGIPGIRDVFDPELVNQVPQEILQFPAVQELVREFQDIPQPFTQQDNQRWAVNQAKANQNVRLGSIPRITSNINSATYTNLADNSLKAGQISSARADVIDVLKQDNNFFGSEADKSPQGYGEGLLSATEKINEEFAKKDTEGRFDAPSRVAANEFIQDVMLSDLGKVYGIKGLEGVKPPLDIVMAFALSQESDLAWDSFDAKKKFKSFVEDNAEKIGSDYGKYVEAQKDLEKLKRQENDLNKTDNYGLKIGQPKLDVQGALERRIARNSKIEAEGQRMRDQNAADTAAAGEQTLRNLYAQKEASDNSKANINAWINRVTGR